MTTTHLVVAAAAAWVEHEGTVYATRVPDGPPLVLAGSGAVVWRCLTGGGTLDEVTERVAEASGSARETVAADVAAFVAGLTDAGLVEREPVDTVGPGGTAPKE